MIRILLIVPDPNFATTQDLLVAMSGMQVETLKAPVTLREVLYQIASDQFEGIHFASRTGLNILQFADGVLESRLLVNALNGTKNLRFVILNGCDTLATAVDIYMQSAVPCVIGWPKSVADNETEEWAETFYRAFRISNNVSDALVSANDMLARFYPASEEPRQLNGRMAVLAARVAELEKEVRAPGQLRVPNWVGYATALILMLLILVLLLELNR